MFENMTALLNEVLPLFPDAQVGEDSEGQIVIYTGMVPSGDDEAPIVPMV